MKIDTARKYALGLPETTEEPHFENSSFRVGTKIFATVPPGGKLLRIGIGRDEVAALVEQDPDAYEVIVWGKREVSDWVQINLAKADRSQVEELLEAAWRARATKRAIAARDAGR